MDFPTLTSDRLVLNEISEADTSALFELFSQPDVTRFYDLNTFTESKQASNLISFFQQRWNNQSGIRWAIRLKKDSRLIGTCGFNSWSAAMKNAVIGYDLHPDYWQQGYAFEAVQSIIQFAFAGALPCDAIYRIQADTIPGNVASEQLLKKLGFLEEGIRRSAGYWKGQFHDLKCFGLLSPSFCSP